MRIDTSLVQALIGIVVFTNGVDAGVLAGFGTALSVGTGFLPPEMRAVTGTIANLALAKQNAAKGIIEVVQNGSDYPYICICPTVAQVKTIKSQYGVTLTGTKCPEDTSMGCKAAQVDMSNAPLPVPASTTKAP